MLSTSLRRKLVAATICSVFVTALGCASPPSPGVCAAIGGVLGGGGGVALGASTPDHNSDEQAIYGGAGAILCASTGYLICRAMQKEEAPPPLEEKIVLRGVNFDFDKADIRPDAAVILDEAASILNDNPGRNVSVA